MPNSIVYYLNFFYFWESLKSALKGIVQPFELGGETTLIRSAVKYWKAGMF
jgi:hypothetical protein